MSINKPQTLASEDSRMANSFKAITSGFFIQALPVIVHQLCTNENWDVIVEFSACSHSI